MALDTRERRSTTPRRAGPRRLGGARPALGTIGVLVGLLVAATLAGLLVDGVYSGSDATAAMLRGYDLVTAVVVVPSLAIAAMAARRGSVVAHLVMASLVASTVYTYAFYLFGTGFNDLFLVHAAIFTAALLALGLALSSLDVVAVADHLGARTRPRVVAGILGVLAVALGGLWIQAAIDNVVTGEVPAGSRLVETETVVHLGMALDLTLLVPLYAAAAVLLWRRAPWGYALAGIALLAGFLHQVGYLVAMPFQLAADVPGAVATDPAEPVIVLVYLIGSVVLLQGARRAGEGRRDEGRQR